MLIIYCCWKSSKYSTQEFLPVWAGYWLIGMVLPNVQAEASVAKTLKILLIIF